MDHDQIIGMLGAFSLDAVDDRERQLIEAHLDLCTMCRTEVGQFQDVASAFSSDAQPPWSLWQRISDAIRSNRRPVTTQPRPWLSLVAALTIVALVGVVAVQQRHVVDLEATVASQAITLAEQDQELDEVAPDRQLVAALDSPHSRKAVLSGEAGSITFVIEPDGHALIADNTLPPLSGDLTYQLWAVIDGEVVSAAVLGPHPQPQSLRIEGQVTVLALTVEHIGGVVVSDREPTAVWSADA